MKIFVSSTRIEFLKVTCSSLRRALASTWLLQDGVKWMSAVWMCMSEHSMQAMRSSRGVTVCWIFFSKAESTSCIFCLVVNQSRSTAMQRWRSSSSSSIGTNSTARSKWPCARRHSFCWSSASALIACKWWLTTHHVALTSLVKLSRVSLD